MDIFSYICKKNFTTMRKDIPGYEGLYAADDRGFIIKLSHPQKSPNKKYGTMTKEVILKPYYTKMKNGSKGYAIVTLSKNGSGKKETVHSLVWRTFNGNYDTNLYCIDHINGIKQDNSLDNLDLVSYNENTLRAFSKGLMSKEFNRSFCRTTPDMIESVITYIKQGYYNAKAERLAGVPSGLICQILRGNSYKSYYTKFIEAINFRDNTEVIQKV